MIVKNEEAVLKRCLDNFSRAADEIIIVDTGSTDQTRSIAARYTDKVYSYTWKGDFADARNFPFSKASMDYILCIDADEALDNENLQKLLDLKKILLPEIEIIHKPRGCSGITMPFMKHPAFYAWNIRITIHRPDWINWKCADIFPR